MLPAHLPVFTDGRTSMEPLSWAEVGPDEPTNRRAAAPAAGGRRPGRPAALADGGLGDRGPGVAHADLATSPPMSVRSRSRTLGGPLEGPHKGGVLSVPREARSVLSALREVLSVLRSILLRAPEHSGARSLYSDTLAEPASSPSRRWRQAGRQGAFGAAARRKCQAFTGFYAIAGARRRAGRC